MNSVTGNETVHQCLFCPRTFGSAVEKDDHILQHFEQETCSDCNQNLIRIGGNFYTLHNTTTCTRRQTKSEVQIEPCFVDTIISDTVAEDEVRVKAEPINEAFNECESLSRLLPLEMAPLAPIEEMPLVPITTEQYSENRVSPMDSIYEEEMIIKEEPMVMQYEYQQDYFMHSIDSIEKKPQSNTESQTSMKSGGEPHICNICEKSYARMGALQNHKLRKHSEHSKVIEKISESKKEIKKVPTFECDVCGKILSVQRSLERHKVLIHSPTGTHFCRYCIKIFGNAGELAHHLPECVRSKTGGPFDCIICKKSFNTDDSFRAHVLSKHNPNNKKFKCEICGRHFAQQLALDKHYTSHDKAAQHPCDYCGRIFPRSDALKCHKVRMHSEPGTHYCTVCCRIFATAEELIEHKSVCGSRRRKQLEFTKHIDEMQLECYICRRNFTRPSALRGHFRLKHSSEAIRFKCTICEKGFSTKFVLDKHTRCHYKSLNDRKLMCSVCGKYLSTNDSLQNHMLVHSGDKPFECPHDECNKHFRNKVSLAEHIRTHSGEKLFSCTIDGCDQRFVRRRDLKRHKFTIHGIFTKKFPCTICGEIFPENTLLKAHIKKHNLQM